MGGQNTKSVAVVGFIPELAQEIWPDILKKLGGPQKLSSFEKRRLHVTWALVKIICKNARFV